MPAGRVLAQRRLPRPRRLLRLPPSRRPSRPSPRVEAALAFLRLNREDGWQGIAPLLAGGCWSTVNLAEVVSKLGELGMPEAEIRIVLRGVLRQVFPFEEADAVEVGRLRPLTRSQGLSLGDRACLALGRRLSRPVLTTYRGWADLDLGVEVRVGR